MQFTLTGVLPAADALVEAKLIELSSPDRRSIAEKQFSGAGIYLLPYPKNVIASQFAYGIQVSVVKG